MPQHFVVCQSSATAAICYMFLRSLFICLYPMKIPTEISSVVEELLAGCEYAGRSLQYWCHAYKCNNVNISFHLAILSGFGGFKYPTTAGLTGVLQSTVKSRVSAVTEFQNLFVLQRCQPFYASRIIISIESTLLIKPHHFVLRMIYLSATRCISVCPSDICT